MSRLTQHLKSQVLAILLFHCSYSRATRPAIDVLSEVLDRLFHYLLKNLSQDTFSSYTTASRVLALAGPLIGRNIGDLNEYIYGVLQTIPKTSVSFLQDRRLVPVDISALQCTKNLVQNNANPPVSFIDDFELDNSTLLKESLDSSKTVDDPTVNINANDVTNKRQSRSKRSRH